MHKPTIAATCRSMILEGKSDAQIWAKLRRVFHFDNDDQKHRSYITWYRCEVRRRVGVEKSGKLVHH
jgi:hypothetical protein